MMRSVLEVLAFFQGSGEVFLNHQECSTRPNLQGRQHGVGEGVSLRGAVFSVYSLPGILIGLFTSFFWISLFTKLSLLLIGNHEK